GPPRPPSRHRSTGGACSTSRAGPRTTPAPRRPRARTAAATPGPPRPPARRRTGSPSPARTGAGSAGQGSTRGPRRGARSPSPPGGRYALSAGRPSARPVPRRGAAGGRSATTAAHGARAPPAGNLPSSLTPPHARLSLASVRTLGNRARGGARSDQAVHASERVPVGVPVPVVLGRVGEEIRRLLSGQPVHH